MVGLIVGLGLVVYAFIDFVLGTWEDCDDGD